MSELSPVRRLQTLLILRIVVSISLNAWVSHVLSYTLHSVTMPIVGHRLPRLD